MPTQIRDVQPVDEGIRHFLIEFDEGVSDDVRLSEEALQLVDPASFGRPDIPPNSQAFSVETTDPGCNARLLSVPSENLILVRTSGGQIRPYRGLLDKETVKRAYLDGAFWTQDKMRGIRQQFASMAEDWDDPRMDVYDDV
jgi:hypothetical protein